MQWRLITFRNNGYDSIAYWSLDLILEERLKLLESLKSSMKVIIIDGASKLTKESSRKVKLSCLWLMGSLTSVKARDNNLSSYVCFLFFPPSFLFLQFKPTYSSRSSLLVNILFCSSSRHVIEYILWVIWSSSKN